MSGPEAKVAIVTGASSGIGLAVARRLADDGMRVVLTDVDVAQGAHAADEIGRGATFLELDVRDEQRWSAVVDQVVEQAGTPRVLVNNAGILTYGPIEEQEADAFRDVLEVNLVGTFLGMKAVIPHLRVAGGGSIVNVSSTCGLQGSPFLGAYTASKWGVRGMSKTAALELADAGIRVNTVHPGGVDTPMVTATMSDEERVAVGANIPVGHLGRPEEVAAVVAFLAGDDATFCTGGEYAADGGYTAGDFSVLRWARENRVADGAS
jgi:3alpha(or 20beta)-hydroxysteroid dehydrogenase